MTEMIVDNRLLESVHQQLRCTLVLSGEKKKKKGVLKAAENFPLALIHHQKKSLTAQRI